MSSTLELGGTSIEIVRSDIKHVHLSVHPPHGRVRIAAPKRFGLEAVRSFAIARLRWIRQQQDKLRQQAREPRREYLDRESHYVWGRRYLMRVVETDAAPRVDLTPRKLILQVRPGTTTAGREAILAGWYRQQVRSAARPFVARWAAVLHVTVTRMFVQRMKTKWGSCNPRAGTIRLNTELAKKPSECLDYIVLHEMLHMLERTHGRRFVQRLDEAMPQWRQVRDLLNGLPAGYERWDEADRERQPLTVGRP